jgi:hypothetical protein
MNKDIQKVWRYAALQWTKHPENQGITSRSGGWIKDSTLLQAIHVL